MNLKTPIDILILTNAPGELATWVRPVIKALRQKFGTDTSKVRISIILSPCPHSTGSEAAIASGYSEVDRVQAAEHFFPFLLWGKTADNWQWRKQGIVIFLGGDQFYTLLIGKRMSYKTIIYAEWEARWYRYIDAFAVMNDAVLQKVPSRYHHKFTVVGDLIADITLEVEKDKANRSEQIIGLLPGSKPAKLMQGVPLCLAVAEQLQILQPDIQFLIPVAPTIDIGTLVSYARSQNNPLISQLGGVTGQLMQSSDKETHPCIITSGGTKISLITHFPPYQNLLSCQLCLTTVGANTAELGALGIPMIVILPTQQLDAMRSWDGIPGILANLPLFGTGFAKLINTIVLQKKRLFAWPNIWAKQEIVPELIGQLEPKEIANLINNYLHYPEKLETMSSRLTSYRGKHGAAEKISEIMADKLISR